MNKVFHKKYGSGKILRKRFGGFEAEILFEGDIKRWIRIDKLEIKDTWSPSFITPKESTLTDVSAREVIESLRLGIVPFKYIEILTSGREKEIKKVRNWFSSKENCLTLTGSYGTGKSHFLQYMYNKALKEGWAVSLVNLDINEVSFYKPKNLYREIISTFRFKEKDGNFREFLKTVSESGGIDLLRDHRFIYKILENLQNNKENEDMWLWIEGMPIGKYYPSLPEYSTCGNIYSHIITAIGWMAKNILKMKGFLILFDEAEILEPYWYTSYQRQKAQNFLDGLVRAAENDESLLKDGEGFIFGQKHINYKGIYSGLIYCARDQSPFLWEIPSSLKLIFALTPLDILIAKKPFENMRSIELSPIGKQELMHILGTIFSIYDKAYKLPFDLKEIEASLYKDVFKYKGIRTFVKAVIEFLDIKRFEGKLNGPNND